MNTFLGAALNLAELGYYVLPIRPREKTPVTLHGVKDATRNRDSIIEWWRMSPEANVAVACGLNNIHVIDVDAKDGGWKSLEVLKSQGVELPETVWQRTPGGGAHFFYWLGDKLKNTKLATGIDIKSTGGYVLVDPSVRDDGKKYQWADGCSPWDKTTALYPNGARPAGVAAAVIANAGQLPSLPDGVSDRARMYLSQCDPAVQGCGGHSKLLWAASAMVHGFTLSDDQAFSLLAADYNPRCEPPWDLGIQSDLRDFTRKIKEARRNPPSKPTGWLLSDWVTTDDSTYTVNLDGILAGTVSLSKPSVAEPPERPANDQTEEHEFITQPGGMLGDICSWVNGNAMMHQPLLTLGCAIAFCGALFGRKIRDQMNLRTNVYGMGVGASSSGKDHAPSCIRELAGLSGAMDLIGGDDFGSDSSIELRMAKFPRTIFMLDEVGHLISSVTEGRNPHTVKILSCLMKLYSSAKSTYLGKEYAEEDRQRVLVEPCCCIWGYATPRRFASGFSSKELEDGWLARCLTFRTHSRPEKNRDIFLRGKRSGPPDDLVERIRLWNTREIEKPDKEGNNLSKWINDKMPLEDAAPAQIVVETTREANEAFFSFDRRCGVDAKETPNMDGLWFKGEENARKVALIYAASRSYDEPIIDAEIADYACRAIRYLLVDFRDCTAPEIVDSKTEALRNRILSFVKAGSYAGRTKSQIINHTRSIVKSQRNPIIEDLIASGVVRILVSPGRQADVLYESKVFEEMIESGRITDSNNSAPQWPPVS